MIIADFQPGNVSFILNTKNLNFKDLENKIQFFIAAEDNSIDYISSESGKITFHFKKEISEQAEEDLEEFIYQTRNSA